MDLFLTLLYQVAPLGILIFLGYFAQKRWNLDARSFSKFLIFCVTPGVLFYSGWNAPIQAHVLWYPVLFFAGEALLSVFLLCLGKIVFKDTRANLLAFSGTDPNTGYFGYPVVVSLLGAALGPLTILVNMGSLMFQNLLGYYYLARGRFEVRDSLFRLLRLPALYAYGLGLLFQILHVTQPDFLEPLIQHFIGTWIYLGMAIVGMGLASVRLRELDFSFLGLAFMGKFLLLPLVVLFIFWMDQHAFQLLTEEARQVFWTLSLCPTAANSVAFSTELNVHPERASSMVFLSSLFALIYIPLILSLGLV